MSNSLNMKIGWIGTCWEEVHYALRRGEFMDQSSVNTLRRMLDEIPEVIERGKENNAGSELFRDVE